MKREEATVYLMDIRYKDLIVDGVVKIRRDVECTRAPWNQLDFPRWTADVYVERIDKEIEDKFYEITDELTKSDLSQIEDMLGSIAHKHVENPNNWVTWEDI